MHLVFTLQCDPLPEHVDRCVCVCGDVAREGAIEGQRETEGGYPKTEPNTHIPTPAAYTGWSWHAP
jgi:hypothetical protein